MAKSFIKMNAARAEELLPCLRNDTAQGISTEWAKRLIEALEFVIEHDRVADPEFVELFKDAVAHLDFCGYGDSYERSCAKEIGLPQRIKNMMDKLKG